MNGKGILSVDKAHAGDTVWLRCCWDDCDRDATTLHKTMFHDHAKALGCDDWRSKHLWYTFCSERHRQLFLNAHISYGNLPLGEHGRIL